MPVVNWFLATLVVMVLCTIAIAAPFLVGLLGAA